MSAPITNSIKRKERLRKINMAKRDLESALLTLKSELSPKAVWVNDSFESLYYLIRLARKAS